MVEERKYVLTKISKGDYLLPSNDGQTIWRLARCDEMGDFGNVQSVWEVWKAPSSAMAAGTLDTDDWGRWELCASSVDDNDEGT